ncbi:hypothetical protein ACVHNB_01315 [Streptomyces sp. YJ-C3]
MDPALLAVASTSANALVSLMTTDIWERAKAGVTKAYAKLSKPSGMVEQELEESRGDLGSAIERGDSEQTSIEVQQMWQGKFRRLLAEHPEAASDLDMLTRLWNENSGAIAPAVGNAITQTATASDSSRIYQQGSGIQFNN